ncbi:MAG TPA: carbohydrate ABC transporter substrate-binding protein, partial [Devosiaceae bacterium]|nr:carbohydrate ABC transporter substrate-binding protein [Devosiaceae bacterium]
MSARHLGLTWDHPRGYEALFAAAREIAPPGLLRWEKQPLEGFESHPIGELAARYDLLVLDHPHVGEAAALDCLLPLDAVFGPEEMAAWSRQTIGNAMRSYLWQGRQLALPLDVATQVSAAGADFRGDPPDDWDAVLRLSESVPVVLTVAGPHALMSFFSLVLSFGAEPGVDDFVADRKVAEEALSILRRLYARTPAFTRSLNPIGMLEVMAAGSAVAYVPLIYGYVNYASGAPGRQPVRFCEAPRGPSGRRGSVLGGTGIALTRRAQPDAPLLDHLRWLMSPEAQTRFIPGHAGQPSAREAWRNAEVNAAAGRFYLGTIETNEAAWV